MSKLINRIGLLIIFGLICVFVANMGEVHAAWGSANEEYYGDKYGIWEYHVRGDGESKYIELNNYYPWYDNETWYRDEVHETGLYTGERIIKATEVYISSEIDGIKLTTIDGFNLWTSSTYGEDIPYVTNVVIPDGVTYIGKEAFQECINLVDVVIPESVTYIDDTAFVDTAWYKNQTSDVPYVISNGMLISWENPTGTIIIPAGVRVIGENLFAKGYDDYEDEDIYYDEVTKIVIPEGVVEIGKNAFTGCRNLEEIVIPETVSKVGAGAFINTKWLKERQ